MQGRGVLLYGAPGCGKTLIARKIGKMLVDKEPKVCPWLCLSVSEVLFSRLHVYVYVTWAVNGPEILTKYVGGNQKHHTQPKF